MSFSTPTTLTLAGLVDLFISFINVIIILLIGLAFVITIWNIISAWIIHANNDTKRAEGKQVAFTAVVVMVIMISVWGILKLLREALF